MVLTRRQTRELSLTPAEQCNEETVDIHNVLTPNNNTRYKSMHGSATKGVLSHPLVDEQPTVVDDRRTKMAPGCSTGGITTTIQESMTGQENRLPTGQEPVVVEITYPLIEEMSAFSHPDEVEDMVRQVESEVQSSEWTIVCSGMNGLRRLAAYHPGECHELVGVALPSIVRGIKSPRSALSKSAIITSRDLFMCLPETMASYVESVESGSLLTQLLLKAASLDKRFVVEEAVKSLEQMALSVNPQVTAKSLISLASHKNPKVRGRCYSILLLVIQSDAWTPGTAVEVGLDGLVRVCAEGTNDNTAEARDSSRRILCMMKDEWICVDDVREHMERCVVVSEDGTIAETMFQDVDPVVARYLSVLLGPSKATLLLKKIT